MHILPSFALRYLDYAVLPSACGKVLIYDTLFVANFPRLVERIDVTSRTVEVLACPITWRPHPEQIAGARRTYENWWLALGWVREGVVESGMLREFEVTAAMPKQRPWI